MFKRNLQMCQARVHAAFQCPHWFQLHWQLHWTSHKSHLYIVVNKLILGVMAGLGSMKVIQLLVGYICNSYTMGKSASPDIYAQA